MKPALYIVSCACLLLAAAAAHAQRACELNGEYINPDHGGMTKGKSGIMRCRDGKDGPVVREEELQNGVFMGIRRRFEQGVLKQEFSVNERGNRDGVYREYAGGAGANNQLLREATYRNGSTVGIVRAWHASGQLRRVSFHDEKGREQAVAEFTPKGQLSDLRCAERALLAPHADDAAWCGHGGALSSVTFYGEDGRARGSRSYERGERRHSETLWENGKPRQQIESTAAGGSERSFAADGVKRREVVWVNQGSGKEARRFTTFDREYHENGTLVRERRYTPGERSAELQLEQRWYLNGQPREKVETTSIEGRPGERETRYHDNGKLAYEGAYLREGRGRVASGVHKQFDDAGRLRTERHYDARGRINREREVDENGKLTRDDEVFEDGSRKSHAR